MVVYRSNHPLAIVRSSSVSLEPGDPTARPLSSQVPQHIQKARQLVAFRAGGWQKLNILEMLFEIDWKLISVFSEK
jgi:hypothetical protein